VPNKIITVSSLRMMTGHVACVSRMMTGQDRTCGMREQDDDRTGQDRTCGMCEQDDDRTGQDMWHV
jgi:hypothetical protein